MGQTGVSLDGFSLSPCLGLVVFGSAEVEGRAGSADEAKGFGSGRETHGSWV